MKKDIKIEKLQKEELENKCVFDWGIWEKEVSKFEWHYDQTEECYLIKGFVTLECENGKKYEFGAGDFITFPKGLDCIWDIKEDVKKHFNFI
jgi:hypothetical protein